MWDSLETTGKLRTLGASRWGGLDQSHRKGSSAVLVVLQAHNSQRGVFVYVFCLWTSQRHLLGEWKRRWWECGLIQQNTFCHLMLNLWRFTMNPSTFSLSSCNAVVVQSHFYPHSCPRSYFLQCPILLKEVESMSYSTAWSHGLHRLRFHYGNKMHNAFILTLYPCGHWFWNGFPLCLFLWEVIDLKGLWGNDTGLALALGEPFWAISGDIKWSAFAIVCLKCWLGILYTLDFEHWGQ